MRHRRSFHDLCFPLVLLLLLVAMLAGCGEDVVVEPGDTDLPDLGLTDAGDTGDTGDTDPGDSGPVPDVDLDTGDTEVPDDAGDTHLPDADTTPQPDTPDVDAEPVELRLDTISPPRGPLEGNTPFVLRGEGFDAETRVFIGIEELDVDLIEDTLVGTTPAADAVGPATVRVVHPTLGEEALVNGFTYFEALHFTSASPAQLPTSGGMEINVRGRGFTAETRASIGGQSALRHTFINAELLRVVAPPGAVGPADLRLTNPDATLLANDALTYVAALDLTHVFPEYGAEGGGELVTIFGQGFAPQMQVFFGTTAATIEAVAPDGRSATLRTPAGSEGPVDVRLELNDDGAFLSQGFRYVGTSPAWSLDALRPSFGSSAGGEEVTLFGGGLDAATLEVRFGTAPATLVEQQPGLVRVLSPPGAPGVVSLHITADGQPDLTLTDAFTYHPPLSLDTLAPTSGPSEGGTLVTLRGQGFTDVSEVTFGGLLQNFSVLDDTTIEVSVGPGAPGPTTVEVRRAETRATLIDAFTFTQDLELWGMSPTRGAIAGGTYVVVRGQGLSPETEITFGGQPAEVLAQLDAHTLALTTPPGATGEVEVRATRDSQQARAPEPFTYFNPGARFGGAWGNPIDGAVNVTVFTHNGGPVENAFVMLSTNANTPYSGHTNAAGMITLSGPDVFGEQTITATAAGHSSVTAQHIDAENITLFLHPPSSDGEGQLPPPPPGAVFTGEVLGLDKVGIPGPDEILMAQVFSTRPSMHARIPEPGGNNVVFGEGTYSINTRVGDLALVAMGGLYNTRTQEFRPLRMGLARYLFASDAQRYEVDIELNIPLTASTHFKFTAPPQFEPGPSKHRVNVYLDLGFDGVFGPMRSFVSEDHLIVADRLARLRGELQDASYSVSARVDNNGALPLSEAYLHDITRLDRIHDIDALPAPVSFITPRQGSRPINGIVQWSHVGSTLPDLQYVFLEDFQRRVVWEAFLPGDATGFRFPEFPDFSHLPADERPVPYPGGTYFLVVYGIKQEGLSADNFSYSDLGGDWQGIALNELLMVF
ncbi:hypothetical protein DL240_08025 [Lujinxingia litoralis]|uniref:IPT/TIG domain-containing protein n=1 Tax=Lujinxingia litoralis TaxID=2211119 RepID=A0A328C5H8_9DELT|nr:IPT/TIG domain-containing protein [Lujinxingia litoralis]RAL22831.1 hypothetical protein DL240_08025 [Lujinxingia litoralis]